MVHMSVNLVFFFFQAEDGIRDSSVTGVQTCALPISITRRMIAPVMAIALALSLATYEFAKPAFAKGPIAAPTTTPLDDNSIGALLSLDQAMETLAARVTPAVVNVAVTS